MRTKGRMMVSHCAGAARENTQGFKLDRRVIIVIALTALPLIYKQGCMRTRLPVVVARCVCIGSPCPIASNFASSDFWAGRTWGARCFCEEWDAKVNAIESRRLVKERQLSDRLNSQALQEQKQALRFIRAREDIGCVHT